MSFEVLAVLMQAHPWLSPTQNQYTAHAGMSLQAQWQAQNQHFVTEARAATPRNCRNCGAPVPQPHPLMNYRGPECCSYCKSEQ